MPPGTLYSAKGPYVAGTVLVGFHSGVSAGQRYAIEHAAGALGASRLGPVIKPVGHGRVTGAEFLAPFELRVPDTQVLTVVDRLRQDPGIAYAEPNYLEHGSATPNDTSFSAEQWGDQNTGQAIPINTNIEKEEFGAREKGTPGADDRATSAWNVTTGSRSIVIGEVDTGVDYTHPDLKANIWSNPGGIGENTKKEKCAEKTHGFNVLNQTCNPMDEDTTYGGHGTHVAGILGATGNNGEGVAGMNWETTILPVKWMNTASVGETAALIKALAWLVKAKQEGVNVRVVNDSDVFFSEGESTQLSNEIEVLGANEILFVTAAGNNKTNLDEKKHYPCAYDLPTEICVTASNNKDELPSWANTGSKTVNLAAPGESIYSTLRGGKYGYLSGGSMASPQVAGAAGLILSAEPSLTATALKARILGSVDKLPSLEGKVITGGRLDVCKAIPACAASLPATFGKTTVGASQDYFGVERKRVNRYAMPTAGGVTKLSVYLEPHAGTTGQQVLKGLVYADNAGAPAALLGTSQQLTFTSTNSAGWYDLAFTSPLKLAAGNYWIGVISGATAGVAGFRWDSVAGSRDYNANTYASGPTNPFGAVTTDAEQTSLYATYETPPTNKTLPTITGTAREGQTLSEAHGTWTNSPTSFAYQWQRCDSAGANCAAIAGATAQTYSLVAADVGHTIRVQETASNAGGPSAPASTTATATVLPLAPTNTAAPTITGTAQEGQTLTEVHGAWTNSPTSFAYQWQRCDSAGANCVAIAGATAQTYVLAAADVGHTIKVAETASNAGGAGAPASSAATGVVSPLLPVNTAPPTITGTAREGQTLTEAHGTWTNSPTSFGYQWQRCDSTGANCSAIAGATAQTYVLAPADVGHTIKVAETASNAGGPSAPASSTATAVVLPLAPANKTPPTITGTAQEGQTLTEVHGVWEHEPTSFAYQWQRCDSTGANCSAIAGASAQTYAVVAADVGHTIRVAETASNAGGSSAPASSSPTSVVALRPVPTNTTPPTITGSAQEGKTLSEAHGSWTGSPTSFAYQWQRCDSAGANCSTIASATAQTYVLVAADVGHTIKVAETASNAGGESAPANSSATAEVLPEAPTNTAPPTITGTAQQGKTLTEVHGSWTNSPTSFAYQWQRCDSTGANCSAIAGATAQTYVLAPADVGHTIKVAETASNAGGPSAPASSTATAVVLPLAPANKTPPTITGTAREGQTLTEVHGTWLREPTSFAYQWLRCDSTGTKCSVIAGATSQTYPLVAGDVGHTIKVQETASNAGGESAPANSSATAEVLPEAPTNTAPPTITGTAQQGKTLTEVHGSWTGSPTSFAYQWLRCDSSGANCSAVAGATTQTYAVVAADVGHTIEVAETASNAGGTSSPASSTPTAVVAPPPVPVNTAAPTITGTAQQGKTLTEHHGSWENEPTSFSYQWLQCDSLGGSCLPIAGATGQTYALKAADVGSTIKVAETASNAGGESEPASSNATAVVLPVLIEETPVNTSPPTISGTAQQGKTLTEHHGSWENEPTSFSYQWLQCDSKGANCSAISAATEQSYVPTSADVGHTIEVAETASNAGGESAPASSSATAEVLPEAPTNTAPPTITGTTQQGKTLTEVHGSWTNSPTSFVYQWQRCDSSGANCSAIASATAQAYVLVAADVGHTIRVAETASNAGGESLPTSSTATAEVLPAVPTNTAPPTIGGTAQQGKTLTEAHGSWTGSPTSFAYQWQRCDSSGANCSAIASATAQTYALVAADVGHTLRVAETASNAGGESAPASSAQTGVVALPPVPANTAPPTITPTTAPQEGKTLTEHNGSWQSEPTSFGYQWLQCDSTGANCTSIPGATTQTYVPAAADVGHTIRVQETATNAGGTSAPTSSAATAEVRPEAPVNTAPPTITGTAQLGQKLTESHGTWTNTPTGYSYLWLRCEGAICTTISGATAQTYLVAEADVGHTIRVQETASNAGGSGVAARSAATAEVPKSVPVNTAPPTITGTTQQGKTLTEAHGTWTNSPTGFSYQWLRCDSTGANCSSIASATAQTYLLIATDGGHTIKVQETASNAGGSSAPASSPATGEILPEAPTNTTPPTITGTAQQGKTLTEAHGSWTNSPTGFTYQWQQCNSAGSGCTAIAGATTQTYVPVAGDVGHTLKAQETASNAGGASTPAPSSATALVTAAASETFGKTTVGASKDYFGFERKRVNRYALPVAGSVTKLSVYLEKNATGQQVLKGLIYADTAGTPAALLGTSQQLTWASTSSPGWYELTFASPVKLAAGNYWIGVITGATSNVAGFRWDSVAGSRDYNANTFASGPTNPFGAATTDAEQTSLYATYTPG